MSTVDGQDVRSTEDLTDATSKGLRWMTHARLGSEVLMFACMVVLARLIPPAAFGEFTLIAIVQELSLSMPMEGIGSALVQRKSIDKAHLEGGLVLSLVVGLGLCLVTVLAAIFLVRAAFNADTEYLLFMATPWFLIGAVYAVPAAILRRRLDFRRLSMMDLASTFVRTGVAVALAAGAGLNASALVIGNMAGIVTALVMALWFVRIPLPRWRGQAIRDLLPYGGPAAFACVAWTGFRNGDYAVIGARLGTTQAGFYWRGYQLAVDYQRKVSAMMAQMAFPVLARTTGQEAMDAMRRRMVQLLTVTLFPLLAGLVLLAPSIVPWIFGPNWEPAVVPAQILALGGASTIVIDAVGSALMAAGRSRMLLAYGVGHFFVYVGCVLLVSSHGIAAVAAAAAVVHTLFLVIAYAVLPRRGEGVLRYLWKDIAPAVVSCVGLLAVAGPVEWALARAGAPAFVHLLAVGAAGALGYGLTLRAFYRDNWRDLMTAVRKVVPMRPFRLVARRIPLLAGR